MENFKKTISMDKNLYDKDDYSKESLAKIEEDFNKCFGEDKSFKMNPQSMLKSFFRKILDKKTGKFRILKFR